MSRWLLVTGDLPPSFVGGVASWTSDLARALAAAGHEVTVLGRAGRGAERQSEQAWDAAQPYTVQRMWSRSWNRWRDRWVQWHARAPLARADRVVCATWELAPHLGPLAAARGVPLAIAFHGSDLTRLATPSPAFRAATGAATALLPVSAFLASELERLGARARSVLPMPLPSPEAAAEEPRSGLLCVARLTPLKGVDRAIALARALDLELTVLGDGPEEDRLRALAGPGVRFLGRVDRAETLAWYRRSLACLLLSRPDADGSGAEGLGLTLIEAMAHGCRAIGCRTGGIPEATGPGLVLDDPERPDLDRVRAFLADPEAPARGRAWVAAHHGPGHAVSVLEEALA